MIVTHREIPVTCPLCEGSGSAAALKPSGEAAEALRLLVSRRPGEFQYLEALVERWEQTSADTALVEPPPGEPCRRCQGVGTVLGHETVYDWPHPTPHVDLGGTTRPGYTDPSGHWRPYP